MNVLQFFSFWCPVLGWAAIIFWLSSIPHLTTGWGIWDLILRKGAHMTEYSILTFLLWRAIRNTWLLLVEKQVLFISVVASVAYAFSDEYHQSFVPGRTASAKDVLIDTIGIVAFVLFYWYSHFKPKESAL